MNKRTILSIIIGTLCFMNVFIPFLGEEVTYFDVFWEALKDEDLSTFWKTVLMAPTGILTILTTLHIFEPKSEFITRNYLATAGIIGFLLYLLIYGLMYLAVTLAFGAGDFLTNLWNNTTVNSGKPGVLYLGWTPVLYPMLFLGYVLVHRYMSYDTPEVQYASTTTPINQSSKAIEDYEEDEFV